MRFYLFFAILVLVSPSSTGAADKLKQDGKVLIEEAVEKANIFALPSFEIKANVRIENHKRMLEGSYHFLWNGSDRWREEITIPGYSEIQVGGKEVVFVKRTTDFPQLRIWDLHSALGYGAEGFLGSAFAKKGSFPDEKVKGRHDRSYKGVNLSCVELESLLLGRKHVREVCVDRSSGALVRREPFHDGPSMPVGTKMFPRILSYIEDGRTIVEIQITEFKVPDAFPPSMFEPPIGSTSRPGCMNPTPAQILKTPTVRMERYLLVPHGSEPWSYSSLGSPPKTDEVLIYALIGTDGVPQEVRAVSSEDPAGNRAGIEFVKQMRFAPPTCNGHAVSFEEVLVAPNVP